MREPLQVVTSWAIACLPAVQEATREDFQARLAEAQRALAARRFEQAEALVHAAVEAHPGEDHVLYDWFEVEDLIADAVFWRDYETPKPAEVVRGRLLSWDASSGKIKIRYRRADGHLVTPPDDSDEDEGEEEGAEEATRAAESAGDFFGSEDMLLHPLVFKGPYTIELEGEELAPRTELPLALVAWRWDSLQGLEYGQAYGVVFGEPTHIFELAEGNLGLLGSGSTLIRYRRPYSFKVGVTKSTISASYNDKQIVRVEREKGEFGQFGFSSFEGLDEVVVSGEIEPSWITGLVDERVQQDVRAFRERFDPFSHLPAWPKERLAGTARHAAEFGEVWPQPSGPKDEAALAKTNELLDDGKLDEALAHARSLSAPDVGGALADWILAHLLRFEGKFEEALEHCQSVCRSDPRLYEARLLRARLMDDSGRKNDGIRELEELVLAFPDHVDTYEDLVLENLVAGRPEGARKALETAVDNGVSPRALTRAGRTVRRSQHGPSWGEAHTWDTKHYLVTSNLSREASYQIACELEEFHRKYVVHVRRPKGKPEQKARVYFFAGEAGYHAYTAELLGDPAENTLGLYSPWLKQLVLWNSPDKRSVLRTARHEGFHQYLDQITGDAPIWLNEGMAEYFEQARRVDGTWKDDQVNLDHLAVLRNVDWTPLEEFVHLDAPRFRMKSGLHYPEAWAFVHFLMNGDAKRKQRIDGLLDALFEGASRKDALERAFTGVDWRAFEAEFRAHVRELG